MAVCVSNCRHKGSACQNVPAACPPSYIAIRDGAIFRSKWDHSGSDNVDAEICPNKIGNIQDYATMGHLIGGQCQGPV